MWRRILKPPSWRHKADGYLVERDGCLEGYAVAVQRIVDPIRHVHELHLEDLVMLTPDAGRRLLTFLADHRSMAGGITFRGAPAEPLLYLLAEQEGKIIHRMDWMLRIVDVEGALTARGYPPGLTAEVHLDVRDDILPHNHGCYVLQVTDSHGSVQGGGNGTFRVDVRGLAAMYTGHLSPAELKAAGYLEGPDEDLAIATAIFAGPTPWMPDIF
jgi:predicted acetyltransferase